MIFQFLNFNQFIKFSIINFSNNKIYKLKSFEKDTTTQLILKIYKYINNKFLLFYFFYLKSLNNIEIITLKIKSLFFISFYYFAFSYIQFYSKILSSYIIFNYNFTIIFLVKIFSLEINMIFCSI